jgi:hypothetical protein
MDKRYQVFVSSTFRDLEIERQEVINALLELDCIPSGMELFPAANESQWNLIKKVIDDCDYYLLILAGRYGSLGPEGQSYTEMEYRYALERAKPIIAFTHKDPGKIILEKSETLPDGKRRLGEFRSLVEKKLCKQWDSPQDLGSVVSRSLVQLIKSTPAIGWVRANELADSEATSELLRLRREVDELRDALNQARTSAPKGSEDLAQGEEEFELRFSFSALTPGTFSRHASGASAMVSWNELFALIAPLMMQESSEAPLLKTLDRFVEERERIRLSESSEYEGMRLLDFGVNRDDFQTIKIQLSALGLIVKSARPRSVKDAQTYWTLTPYGDEVMTRLRAIRRGGNGGRREG